MKNYSWGHGLSLLLLATIPSPAHAGEYTLTATPSATQVISYDRGIGSIDSVQKQTIVRLVNVTEGDSKSAIFVIGILNTSNRPFHFGPENISVRAADLKPIALTTYEQAMEAARKKEKRQKFWAGVAAVGRGMSAANAGTTYESGIYSGTASGYVGNNLVTAQTSGIYSGTQYNSAAALAAQRNAREMNAQDRANLEAQWASRRLAASNMLRTTTVNAGTMYGGVARFPITPNLKKLRQPVEVTIEVDVAGEKHTFLARLSPVN